MSFAQCSSSVARLLNLLLFSSKWIFAALPHHRECTNLHQSAYLDQNRYCARYPHHRTILHREELYANTHIWPASWRFGNVELRKCYRLVRVAFQAVVESALESTLCVRRVEAHLYLCISSMSADSLRCHFGKERPPDVWFWWSIAGCLCFPTFSSLGWGNSTPRFFSSRTSVRGFLMRYFVSSITVREKPSLAILPVFNARRMSDCSGCTWPPRLAILADMSKTYKTSVAASNNEI